MSSHFLDDGCNNYRQWCLFLQIIDILELNYSHNLTHCQSQCYCNHSGKGNMLFLEGIDMFYLSSTDGRNKKYFTTLPYSLIEVANFKAKYKLRTTCLSFIRFTLATPNARKGIPFLCSRGDGSRDGSSLNKMRFQSYF